MGEVSYLSGLVLKGTQDLVECRIPITQLCLEVPLCDRTGASSSNAHTGMNRGQKRLQEWGEHIDENCADDIEEVVDVSQLQNALVCDLEKCERRREVRDLIIPRK